MTNREIIEKKLKEKGYKLGCWSSLMEVLPKKQLEKVIANMFYEEDTDVLIRRRLYVVEIDEVDGEIDFSVLSQGEYISRYGDERWDEEC